MPTILLKSLEIAAAIRHPNAVAAFSAVLACFSLLKIVSIRNRPNARVQAILLLILSASIVILGCLPIVAATYLSVHGVYEVRIIVLDPSHNPTDNSTVVCSPGGEQKPIRGGWECDVTPRNRPEDGMFTAYASWDSAFLSGSKVTHLGDDYNPTIEIQLVHDTSASLKGEVKGTDGHTLQGAWVSVVGAGTAPARTEANGGFEVPTHEAAGQMITLHVECEGYVPYEGLQMAGDDAAIISLKRNR